MLHAFFLSFGVIFVAELGDKSQLMALAFATRYKTLPVLIAITLATGIVHLISVGIGGALGSALPTDFINIVGALARSMATTGYSDLKEFQRVEVVIAPYVKS